LVDALGIGKDKRQENVTMIVFEQAGHNNISQSVNYYKNLTSFLDGLEIKTRVGAAQQIVVQ
jgi:hypothetical protein